MNKDYDNVIRIATSLDFHDDTDLNASCLVYYYKAQAYVKLENYPMAKEAFFREFELRKKYLGWEDEDTILACQNLGVLHSFCNEREEALACFREAYGHEVKRMARILKWRKSYFNISAWLNHNGGILPFLLTFTFLLYGNRLYFLTFADINYQ